MFVTRLQKAFDQTANAPDVDGNGPAEVVARGVDGLYKWHFDKQTFRWKEPFRMRWLDRPGTYPDIIAPSV
jgi:hypothetical protein